MLGKPFGLALFSPVDDGQGTDGVRALNHTPGPWIVVAGADPRNKVIIAANGAGQPAVAETRSESFADGCKPDVANAQLIAAAPDLLEVVRRIVDTSWCSDFDEVRMINTEDFHAASRALVKATRSANAVPSQTVTDSPEERQQQGETK